MVSVGRGKGALHLYTTNGGCFQQGKGQGRSVHLTCMFFHLYCFPSLSNPSFPFSWTHTHKKQRTILAGNRQAFDQTSPFLLDRLQAALAGCRFPPVAGYLKHSPSASRRENATANIRVCQIIPKLGCLPSPPSKGVSQAQPPLISCGFCVWTRRCGSGFSSASRRR